MTIPRGCPKPEISSITHIYLMLDWWKTQPNKVITDTAFVEIASRQQTSFKQDLIHISWARTTAAVCLVRITSRSCSRSLLYFEML